VSNLLYVGIAIALSILAILVLWYRNRKPKSLVAGIEEFQRELRALAPGSSGSSGSPGSSGSSGTPGTPSRSGTEQRNRRSAG
jgi:hypothetical protein